MTADYCVVCFNKIYMNFKFPVPYHTSPLMSNHIILFDSSWTLSTCRYKAGFHVSVNQTEDLRQTGITRILVDVVTDVHVCLSNSELKIQKTRQDSAGTAAIQDSELPAVFD